MTNPILANLTPQNAVAMEVLTNPRLEKLFKSNTKSIKYIFKNGHVANFVRGRYTTSDPVKIAELMAEVEANHPEIHIDQNELEIDPRMEDPKLRMRAEILKDLMEANLVATNPERDMGEYSPGKMNPQSTQSIASVMAGGNATQLSAQVAALVNPNK
jgi:hypothetical protein